MMFVKGSKTEYDMKNMVKVMLYWFVESFKSVPSLAIFALPMFVRSKNASRYRIHSFALVSWMTMSKSFHCFNSPKESE